MKSEDKERLENIEENVNTLVQNVPGANGASKTPTEARFDALEIKMAALNSKVNILLIMLPSLLAIAAYIVK